MDGRKGSPEWVVIWKRENGAWKLQRDIWNTSLPRAKLPGIAVLALLVVAVGGLFWFVRHISRTGTSDTLGQALVVALVSSLAGHGTSRLSHNSAYVVFAIVMVSAVVVVAVAQRSQKTFSVPKTTYPDAAAPSGSSRPPR